MSGIQERLNELKSYLVSLANNNTTSREGRSPLEWLKMFSTVDDGGVALNDEETAQFSAIVEGISSKMGPAISIASLSGQVEKAILKTLDQNKRSGISSAIQRAEQATNEVKALLLSKHHEWITCVPILGVTPPKRSWSLGNIEIANITGKHAKGVIDRVNWITDHTLDPPDQKAAGKAQFRKYLIEDHPNQAFALIHTQAIEAGAAWASAKRRLRFVLDCLNLALDFIDGPKTTHGLSYSEPPKRHFLTAVTLNATSRDFAQTHTELSECRSIECDAFQDRIAENPALRQLMAYLKISKLDGHANRILAAAQWAGRATVERRPEQAFLFRAIALESLILGDGNQAELSNRLALSAVHLLGNGLKSRKDGMAKLKTLYGIRSKIVHSGQYEVADSDADLMRGFTLRCFSRILSDPAFRRLKSKNDLDDWFNAKMRGD